MATSKRQGLGRCPEPEEKAKIQQDRKKKERALKLIQNLEEVQETQANGGITNAEKLIEETKEAVAKTQLEIKKEF